MQFRAANCWVSIRSGRIPVTKVPSSLTKPSKPGTVKANTSAKGGRRMGPSGARLSASGCWCRQRGAARSRHKLGPRPEQPSRGPGERSPLLIRRTTRERRGRTGVPWRGDADPRWRPASPLSGNRRGSGCRARPRRHVAPGSRPRELRGGGAVGWSPTRTAWGRPGGEHPGWAGTAGEAGPRGLLHRTTAAAPASRLLQACTRHRPQQGPTPRPAAAAAAEVAAPSRTPSSLGSRHPTLSRDPVPAVPALERPPQPPPQPPAPQQRG